MLGKASMRIAPQVPWLATPRHSTCLGVDVQKTLLARLATSRALAPLAAGSRTQPGVPTGRGIRVYVRGETRRYARFLPYLPPQKLGIVSHVNGNACFHGDV